MPEPEMKLPNGFLLRAAFDRTAANYDRHAVLEREVADRLMERLEFVRDEPVRVVDLGSGTGYCCEALKRRFPEAEVIGLDASFAMSRALGRRANAAYPIEAVCADLSLLPFASCSVDLLLSNLAFQWSGDFRRLFEGFRHILRPGGMLLFSTLGPDSLTEFKSAAGLEESRNSLRNFPDMHDVGDALLAAGFSEPVMDSEHITMEYQRMDSMMDELEATGVDTHFDDWGRHRENSRDLMCAYREFCRNGRYPVTWEIVYGTAFGPDEGQPFRTPEGEVAAFSVDYLRGSMTRR